MNGRPRGAGLRAGAGDDGPVDLGLRVMTGGAGLCLLVWGWGQLAGLVLGGGRPALPLGRTPRVVAALPGHLADPAAAWPAADRALLPGPAGFYLVLVAALALGAALALIVRAAVRARHRRADPLGARRAGWARPGDLAALRVARTTPGRLTLGRAGRALLAAEPRQSVVVIGPTGSMKTSGFAVPAILEWEGPVLATSVKTDLVADTLAARSACGRALVYDPTGATGLAPARWSPLGTCADWEGAQRTASWLVGAAEAREGLGEADFWHRAAAKLLAPLLLAAAGSGAEMADVVRWLDAQDEDEPLSRLRTLGDADAERALLASLAREERQRSSIYTTAETLLSAFADPGVAASAAGADVSGRRLVDGGADTLYLCAPAHEQRRLRPLFVCLVQEVLAAAYARGARAPLSPPLLVVLDEAANIAALPDLDGIAATAAGHGVQLVSVWHDLAQMRARYGPRADTLLSNHRAKVVLSGVSDPTTLDLVSRLVGEAEAEHSSSTRGPDGRRSRTQWRAPRRLAAAADLRRVRPGEGVLVYGHLPPATLRLRPWFAEPQLRRRAEAAAGPPAASGHGAPASGRPRPLEPSPRPPVPAPIPPGREADGEPSAQEPSEGVAGPRPGGLDPDLEQHADAARKALSPTEAARLLGVSRQRVYERWASGRLAFVTVPDARGRPRRKVPLAAVARELGVAPQEVERRLRDGGGGSC